MALFRALGMSDADSDRHANTNTDAASVVPSKLRSVPQSERERLRLRGRLGERVAIGADQSVYHRADRPDRGSAMTAARSALRVVEVERRAGLVVRVSTDTQARNDEGSLKTQLQRLREHLRYKQEAVGEPWSEAALYELKGVSGKNSIRSKEFERLFADIRSGRVNTIVCTSLDRICRSVSDFLHFFEFLSEHDTQFVCLKQQYDTTSPQGRLFVTIMMALAQFEREQTSERTRDATAARAERGLWNGGRLVGLDAERKGYLVVNPEEAAAVGFGFAIYVETGSIGGTAEEMNRRGFRTPTFTSRREVEHPGREFSYSAVQRLLKNPAYVGRKIIDARGERRTVEAVWPGIVDPETFERAQRLLVLNGRSNHNQAKSPRHVHTLGAGLLSCGRCGTSMQGRSGTGRLRKTYFYYGCPTAGCGMRAVAAEVEDAVISRIGALAADPETVTAITERANLTLRRSKPEVERRLRALNRTLRSTDGEADHAVRGLGRATPDVVGLLNDKLAGLARRRDELQSGILEAERELTALDAASVDAESVRDGLRHFGRAFTHLRPFEQKELIRLVLKRAELRDRELVLEIYGNAVSGFSTAAGEEKANPGEGFAEACTWLPDARLGPTTGRALRRARQARIRLNGLAIRLPSPLG